MAYILPKHFFWAISFKILIFWPFLKKNQKSRKCLQCSQMSISWSLVFTNILILIVLTYSTKKTLGHRWPWGVTFENLKKIQIFKKPKTGFTLLRMVIHHPKYGHQRSKRNTIPRRVTNHPKICHPPTQGKPPTITRMVTHCPNDMVAYHPQGGHPTTVEW